MTMIVLLTSAGPIIVMFLLLWTASVIVKKHDRHERDRYKDETQSHGEWYSKRTGRVGHLVTGEPSAALRAFGLSDQASPAEVLAAYRQLALELHPDRGGDPSEFKQLQRNFERAMTYAESRVAANSLKPR